MITAEIRVNTELIGHLTCVNTGKQYFKNKNYTWYECVYWDAQKQNVKKLDLSHCPDDGFQELLIKALNLTKQQSQDKEGE